jgi:hypothetical protein
VPARELARPVHPGNFLKRSLTAFLALMLAGLSGCDFLLGPDPSGPGTYQAPQWSVHVVAEGEISGLDMTLGPGDVPIASYVHEGQLLRVSSYADGAWTTVDGPTSGAVEGAIGAISTHVVAAPDGRVSVLHGTASEVLVTTVGAAAGPAISLAGLQVALRDSIYPPPTTWSIESSTLAYGPDGLLRIVARDASDERLWLFREVAAGWTLGAVPFSDNVSGSTQLKVAESGNEHVLFQANSQGYYFWWRETEGWLERLRFVAGLPYLLRLRANEASVLALRSQNDLRVAEERYDPILDGYWWEVRNVVSDQWLFWHNHDLVLDETGFPTHVYILGPMLRDEYEIWVTRLLVDGTWEKALVAANLQLPVFNPFNVRMVRSTGGTLHIMLTTGEHSNAPGDSREWRHRLIHLESDTPFGD